jgi:hypothetical protein
LNQSSIFYLDNVNINIIFRAFLKLQILRNVKGHTVVYRDVPQYREIPNIRNFIAQQSSMPDNSGSPSSTSADTLSLKKKRDHRSVSQEKWKLFKAETQISSEPLISLQELQF